MVKEPEISQRRSGLRILDMMVIIAGVALALALFRMDLAPEDYTVDGYEEWTHDDLPTLIEFTPPERCCRRDGYYRLMIDPETRWRSGFPLTMWYLLAGPTVAGSFIVLRRRRFFKSADWSSGQTILAGLGLLLWIEILLLYLPCYTKTNIVTYHYPWHESHPYLNACVAWLFEVGHVIPGLLLLAIPPVALLLISRKWRRRHLPREPWDRLGFIGMSLGFLWFVRTIWLVAAAITYPEAYFQFLMH